MNVSEAHNALLPSPHTYFKNALLLFENEQLPAALQAIDAAIVFSNNSPFYIYQKIRTLYKLGALKSCSQLIVSQLEYLYKYSSLYILCRSIDYLQKINHYTTLQLQALLKHSHIPYCLAQHYETWLTSKHKPILALAKRAIVQDDYPLALCYCEIYLKLYNTCDEITQMQAYAYHYLGDLVTAKKFYLSYLESSKTPAALCDMGLITMELGEYETAINYFKQLLQIDSSSKTYLSYLGECYLLSKKVTLAIETYELIAKNYPDDIQNAFNLSHAYMKANKKWRAKHYLNHIKKQLTKKA